jgi:hypothetical protein
MSPAGSRVEIDIREQADSPAARFSWIPFALSAGIDLAAVASIALSGGRLASYLVALAIHGLAVLIVLELGGLTGSGRLLTAALAAALPLAGVALAALALGTRREAGLVAAITTEPVDAPTLDAASFAKIANALSPCEVLSAPGSAEGWAMLAALSRRGDAESVRLLRWLIVASPNMAVDAALALEDLSTRFDAGLERRRLSLAKNPSAASAIDEGAFITSAMESGLVDPVMLEVRAAEARRCFARARELAPGGGQGVTQAWARMELAALCPDTALGMVDEALTRAPDGHLPVALLALREEARFASHAHGDGARPERTPVARTGLVQ